MLVSLMVLLQLVLFYLINNDITSNSSKNLKAKDLGIKIISEQDFQNNKYDDIKQTLKDINKMEHCNEKELKIIYDVLMFFLKKYSCYLRFPNTVFCFYIDNIIIVCRNLAKMCNHQMTS